MKWFQLQTNSLYDPKVVKLIKQHGIAGYGVYMGINVLIAERDANDFTLEHDLEGLETLFNEPKTSEIVESCLKLGLITKTKGKLQNVKIEKYMGNWQKRTKENSVVPTEGLQRAYSDPTAKKRREGRERKKKKSNTPFPTLQ